MYGDPEHDSDIAALPSTSFGGDENLDFGDDELVFKKGKHRKSKSYANISEFERGRRRESGRRTHVLLPRATVGSSWQRQPETKPGLQQ
jgi:hypothetical protein